MKNKLFGMLHQVRGQGAAQKSEGKNSSIASQKSIRFESIEPRVLMAADAAIAINGSIDAPGEIDQYGLPLHPMPRLYLTR